jgi:hypothetical protein
MIISPLGPSLHHLQIIHNGQKGETASKRLIQISFTVPNSQVTEVANKHLQMYQIRQYEDIQRVNYGCQFIPVSMGFLFSLVKKYFCILHHGWW